MEEKCAKTGSSKYENTIFCKLFAAIIGIPNNLQVPLLRNCDLNEIMHDRRCWSYVIKHCMMEMSMVLWACISYTSYLWLVFCFD